MNRLKEEIRLLSQDVKKADRAIRYWGSDYQWKIFKKRVEKRLEFESGNIKDLQARMDKIEKELP